MNLWNLYSRFYMNADDGSASGAPPVEAAPPEADAPVEELDLDGELTQDSFDRAYVERVRKEAARHRTSAKELQSKYDSLYDGFDDREDVDYLIELARTTLRDPSASVAQWERILDNIKAQAGIPETPAEPDPDADKPLTKADLERFEKERAVAAAQREIEAEATTLGYEIGSHQYDLLLRIASKETRGDIQAAHAKLEAEREEIGKAAVAAYLKQVEENADAFPPVAGGSAGTGAPAGGTAGGKPKTFAEARASAEARIAAMQRGS